MGCVECCLVIEGLGDFVVIVVYCFGYVDDREVYYGQIIGGFKCIVVVNGYECFDI